MLIVGIILLFTMILVAMQKSNKKHISEMKLMDIVYWLNQTYKETVEKKRKKYPPEKNSNKLLDNELTYGPHGKHNESIWR